ncbi:MAG TPA: cytochrome c oxidase subunit II [Aestuariivirgaceae bacterium]|nr:cytochrome c oxidase subunit II [Aestuariivirgaceae bacterium]
MALGGCAGEQSALSAGGPAAAAYALLGNIMYAGATAILALVMGLTAFAILAPPERRAWLARRRTIVAGGIVFPIVTLSVLLVYGYWLLSEAEWSEAGRAAAPGPGYGALAIEVVGEQFWWRVRYLDGDGQTAFESANEIRVPTGRPVRLMLSTADVIHSFWVPSLAGKLDMIPGRTTTLTISADREGLYRGQCAEYCGAQHAHMAFHVVAMAPGDFEAWLSDQMSPPPEPADEDLARGLEVFLTSGCGACHTIRGTEAAGALGPDLTRVGSRVTIAAGMFPTNTGTLAGWIASSQHLKPGNKMPSFDALGGPDLRAVAAYLESLK